MGLTTTDRMAEHRESDVLWVRGSQVGPNYFETFEQPLVAGRYLSDADRDAKVIVINEAAARKYWPGRDALGQEMSHDATDGMRTVVGIVGNLSYQFNRHLRVGGGMYALPGSRTLEGNFPFWLPLDNRLIERGRNR